MREAKAVRICVTIATENNPEHGAEYAIRVAIVNNRRMLEHLSDILEKYRNNIMKEFSYTICGSTNIVKISTVDRVGSVTLTGIASSKIGKQYECKKCKW